MELNDAAVLNRMRKILRDYRYNLRGKDGKKLSWPDLTGLIELHYRNITGRYVEFLQNALATFVIGTPERDPKKKAKGLRHFTIPEGERMDAIVLFLTDSSHGNEFACFTKEELFETPAKQAPLLLLDFLHFGKTRNSYLKAERLKGTFQSEAHDGVEITLDILSASENGHLVVDIGRVFLSNGKREQYKGWGVIAPQETIHVYVQNTYLERNFSYLLVGFDKSFYFSDEGTTLVLLESDFPNEIETGPHKQSDLLAYTHAALREKVLVLTRL